MHGMDHKFLDLDPNSRHLEGLQVGVSTVPLCADRLGRRPWDADLHATMVANGVAVYEKAVLDKNGLWL
jgi:hypothetical protein